MTENWKEAEGALNQLRIEGNENNEPVTVIGDPENLYCIGIGTDAAVFRYTPAPAYAFKVFSPHSISKKTVEQQVYERIGESPYFARCYGAGFNYLVLSYEPGTTLYDCLIHGISIPKQVVTDVEDARSFVQSIGLNPRDIHLKNVLLQNGRAKLLDISEYVKSGDDRRWEHLKKGYEDYYPLLDGRPIPNWILETVKKWYNRIDLATFTVDDFGKRIMQLFFKHRE